MLEVDLGWSFLEHQTPSEVSDSREGTEMLFQMRLAHAYLLALVRMEFQVDLKEILPFGIAIQLSTLLPSGFGMRLTVA